MKIIEITGKFHLTDGQTVDFRIGDVAGTTNWTQWGNNDDHMFITNGLAEALTDAAREHMELVDDNA